MRDQATSSGLTSYLPLAISIGALLLSASTMYFATRSNNDERNARLVEIGVRVLMVDPAKNTQVKAAREWALDLIDRNAGVTFSPDARAQLLEKPLDYGTTTYAPDYGYTDYAPTKPTPQRSK